MTGVVPVFVVDDSPQVQSALRQLIETVGPFRVVGTAAGETQATDWLLQANTHWRLAVLDLLLEEGSGFGLVHRCRVQQPTSQVVIFSEYASPAIRDRCLQLGADAAFLKSDLKSFVQYLETFAHRSP